MSFNLEWKVEGVIDSETVKVVTVMRWYAQDEVNQEDSEQNVVDRMKKGADSTGNVLHIWKNGWWFVMRKIQMVKLGWQTDEEWVLHVDWTEINGQIVR